MQTHTTKSALEWRRKWLSSWRGLKGTSITRSGRERSKLVNSPDDRMYLFSSTTIVDPVSSSWFLSELDLSLYSHFCHQLRPKSADNLSLVLPHKTKRTTPVVLENLVFKCCETLRKIKKKHGVLQRIIHKRRVQPFLLVCLVQGVIMRQAPSTFLLCTLYTDYCFTIISS